MDITKENIYRKKECELCGKYAFEKWLGTSAVLDGGFTRVEDFEKSGFGSIVVNYWGITSLNNSRLEYRLCPDCAREIDVCIRLKIDELKTKKEE